MIKVIGKPINTSEIEDSFGMHEALANFAIEGMVGIVEEHLKGLQCKEHPLDETVVLITGNQPGDQKMVRMEITKVCCKEFKDSIKLTID